MKYRLLIEEALKSLDEDNAEQYGSLESSEQRGGNRPIDQEPLLDLELDDYKDVATMKDSELIERFLKEVYKAAKRFEHVMMTWGYSKEHSHKFVGGFLQSALYRWNDGTW